MRTPEPVGLPAKSQGTELAGDTGSPLSRLTLTPILDGSQGSNRGRSGVCQLGATTDLEAVRAWLAEYADSARIAGQACERAYDALTPAY